MWPKYVREQVDDEPSNQHELSLEDEDNRLKTVRGCKKSDSNDGEGSLTSRNYNDEVDKLWKENVSKAGRPYTPLCILT